LLLSLQGEVLYEKKKRWPKQSPITAWGTFFSPKTL
jgi:hypothetical protein